MNLYHRHVGTLARHLLDAGPNTHEADTALWRRWTRRYRIDTALAAIFLGYLLVYGWDPAIAAFATLFALLAVAGRSLTWALLVGAANRSLDRTAQTLHNQPTKPTPPSPPHLYTPRHDPYPTANDLPHPTQPSLADTSPEDIATYLDNLVAALTDAYTTDPFAVVVLGADLAHYAIVAHPTPLIDVTDDPTRQPPADYYTSRSLRRLTLRSEDTP